MTILQNAASSRTSMSSYIPPACFAFLKAVPAVRVAIWRPVGLWGLPRIFCKFSLNSLASLGFTWLRLASLGFRFTIHLPHLWPGWSSWGHLAQCSQMITDVLSLRWVSWASWLELLNADAGVILRQTYCDMLQSVAKCWGFSRLAAIHRGTYMLLSSSWMLSDLILILICSCSCCKTEDISRQSVVERPAIFGCCRTF